MSAFTDQLPPLSREVLDALTEDIALRGQLVPVDVDEDGVVLDGAHRLTVCESLGIEPITNVVTGLTEPEKFAYALAKNLNRRNLTLEQRADVRKRQQHIYFELREQGLTQQQAAALVGVARQTGTDWESAVTRNADPGKASKPKPKDKRTKLDADDKRQIAERVESGEETQEQIAADFGISQQRVGQVAKKQSAAKKRKAERAASATAAPTLEIRPGDFRDVLADVPDASVDLILTDPPYAVEHLELYADLGRFGARVLKPGGSLIAYAGQSTLPDVLDRLRSHLRYWWTLSLTHGHGGQQMLGKYVLIEWKPLVWFVNGHRRDQEFVADQIRGARPDKDAHPWAQGIEEVVYLIDKLTTPGELVVDPFAGSGSFGIAATKMGRGFIGADIPHAEAVAA